MVFDISVTPNRGDATGVYGMARDLAAFGIGTLKDGKVPTSSSPGGKGHIGVNAATSTTDEPKAIRMFAGRLITGVKNGPSPRMAAGAAARHGPEADHAVVDITNFVTFDRGRPLHVFDADSLDGSRARAHGQAGRVDSIALDSKTYELDQTMMVIADDLGPARHRRHHGRQPSGSSDATTNVFVGMRLVRSRW